MSSIPHYCTLINGATFAGLGIAAAAKDRTLVVERTNLTGHEYVSTFRPGKDWQQELKSAGARELKSDLEQRALLSSEGSIYLAPVSVLLFHHIRKQALHVLMMTEIVHVQQLPTGIFEVTLLNASGLQKVTADAIVDTTSTCRTLPEAAASYIHAQSIHAVLHCQPNENGALADPPVCADPEAHIETGLHPGEVMLHYQVDIGDDWTTSRHKLFTYWQLYQARFTPWKLALVADAMNYRVQIQQLPLADRWLWFPSCVYANLLLAFDAGYLKGEALHDQITLRV